MVGVLVVISVGVGRKVSPHLNVVKMPIGEPIEAWQSKVYRAVWAVAKVAVEL